jgi:hypothetical protein
VAALRIPAIGVASVHHDVITGESRPEGLADLFGRLPVRHVDKNYSGWRELLDELINRCRRVEPPCRKLPGTFAVSIVPDDFMSLF